ncbi:hypothetical protein SD70_08985 [Gordoniibacillus kamchatkensis]|uniref:YugN-like family protein n=1 Tax=Gordoniibacillus kamchatkensis TaxID=1590651 RepID=A0ABR5AKV8_9BACL|nr:YugN family protein [Paenibacillus sp. VKM B-2647]KIL41155.1 hypothetical protein SD70_08985 [Paenibacillus sp. VKM B-2647]
MIIETNGLKGKTTDFAHLEETTQKLGFVRWQWEYTRATYDYKIEDKAAGAEYYLRFNIRVESGKLESPYAVVRLEDSYIGRATFPHGLDYESPIPEPILKTAKQKLAQLQEQLSD